MATRSFSNPKTKGRRNTRSTLNRRSNHEVSTFTVLRHINIGGGQQLTILISAVSKLPIVKLHPTDQMEKAVLSCGGEVTRVDVGPHGRLSLLEDSLRWIVVFEQVAAKTEVDIAKEHARAVRKRLLQMVKEGTEGCIPDLVKDIYTTPAKNGGSRARRPYSKSPRLPTALAAWKGRM